MLRTTIQILAAGLVVLAAEPALARTGPHFQEGRKFLEQMEYDEALTSFRRALTWPGNSPQDRATIYLHIGIVQSNQGQYDAAEESFKQALAKDPRAKLPAMTSPKIEALFERVRAETLPKTQATEPAAAPALAEPEPEVTATEQPSGINWPAWATLGVAVAAAGTGLAMGLLYQSEKEQAEDLSTRYDQAVEHADRANSRGLAATILFSAASAAAVASAILFYLGSWRSDRSESTSATVVPMQSGVMFQLEVRR